MDGKPKTRALLITTHRESLITDPQTVAEVRLLSSEIYERMPDGRPVRILHKGAYRYLNTRYVYSWQTIDTETGEPVTNT